MTLFATACLGSALIVGAVGGVALQAQAPQAAPDLPPVLIDSLAGGDSFGRYCAPCHGAAGRGDGPVAPALRTRPADLTALARRNNGSFPRERVRDYVAGPGRAVAAHGTTEMPIWGPLFRAFETDARVRTRLDNLIAHIETLQTPSTGVNERGSLLFRTHCASCHGPNGRGDGPLAAELRRQPPDLTRFAQRNGGVFPSERVYAIIDGRGVPSHGDRDMPVWGDAFRAARAGLGQRDADARIAAIVRYLEGIQERAAE